jgi:predicted HicB family RNase H-like nuclease
VVSDAYARIPEQCRDRLVALAAAVGMSLRAYVAQLTETLLAPD